MGLFGKMFEKKECSVCGGEIGLLGNRKLEDGNLCKECAKKLSPWFSERRHSTVEEINQQLAYREENKKKVAQFSTTHSIGDKHKMLTDDTHRWLTVTQTRNMTEENPDILDYQSIVGCRLDIDESRIELKRENKDGTKTSYNPPRYEYSYDFDVIIAVNNPYFDEIRFRLNSTDVKVTQGVSTGVGGSFGRLLDNLASSGYDPMNNPEYRRYHQAGNEFCEEVRRIQALASGTQYIPQGGQQYGQQYVQQGNPQYGQQYAPQGNPQYGQQYAPQGNPQYGQQYAPQGNPQYGQQYAPQGNPQYGQQYAPQGNPQYGQQYAPQGNPQYGQQQYAQQGNPQYVQQAAPQAAVVDGPWVCSACKGQNSSGKFCEYCGAQRQ